MTAIWVYETVSSFHQDPCRQAVWMYENDKKKRKSHKIFFINAMSPNKDFFS